ncbi:hypothetical protein C8R47DRAFT_1203832 [Mycena vitilis]|nr:hypothetical protein C8R47DRAFT_1203832 [Mycena vitilis]
MSSLATLCDLPIRTVFDGTKTSCVSLDWVIKSGLRTLDSQISGPLTLSSDVGVVSMRVNDIPVADSLPSDLLLGLDWFDFVRSSAPELVVHLDYGGSLEFRHSPPSIVDTAESGPLSTAIPPVAGVDGSLLPSSVSLGNPDAVTAPSSIPHTRGLDVVAASMHAPRTPRSRGVPPSRTRDVAPINDETINHEIITHDITPVAETLNTSCSDDPFVYLTLNEKTRIEDGASS